MQTVINPEGQPAAIAGMIADSNDITDVVSRFSEEASAEIPFGYGVVQGTATQGVKLPSGSGDIPVGVNVFGYNHMPGTIGDLGTTGLKPKAGLQVLRQGRIWVQLDQDVTTIAPNTDRTYLRYSANSPNLSPGRWAKAADSGHTIDLTKVGVFVSGAVAFADGTKGAVASFNFVNKP